MRTSRLPVKLVETAVFLAGLYFALQLALYWGVETKTWWERSWDIVAGGALGTVAGIVGFLVVGAIGWVAGPLFGAVGLLGLMGGGALGGMGLGALVHIVRDPHGYNIDMPVVVLTLLAGGVLARVLASFVGGKLTASLSADQEETGS